MKQLESKQVLRRAHGGLGGNLGVLGPGDVSGEMAKVFQTNTGANGANTSEYQQASYSVGTAPAGSRTYSAAQILNRGAQQ